MYKQSYNPRRPYYMASKYPYTWIGKHPNDDVVRSYRRHGPVIRKMMQAEAERLNDEETAKG